jgi:hypothetical protein
MASFREFRFSVLPHNGVPIVSPPADKPPPQGKSGDAGSKPGVKGTKKNVKEMGLLAGVISAVGLGLELERIDKNKDLDKEERAREKGGAWGHGLGTVAGAVLGGYVGGHGGALVLSQVLGAAGRWAGEEWLAPVEEWKEENAERTRQKGHYEFTGVNGTPVWVEADESTKSPYKGGWEPDENGIPKWVEADLGPSRTSGPAWERAYAVPRIPASILPELPGAARTVEGPLTKAEAELTGSVNVVIDVRDGRVETRARSDTSLVRPTVTNPGHTPDARDISP